MTITVKFRRGNTSTSNTLTLANGELYIDTTKRTVVVHDGSTLGGNPLATESALFSGLAVRPDFETVNTSIQTAISNLIGAAPSALDTLNELAAALGNNANYASTVTTALGTKQNTLVSGTNIKTIGGSSLLGSGDLSITSLGTITNKSITFDTGLSSTEYTGIKLKNNFCTFILGNNIPNSNNATFFIHADWLNTGTPQKTALVAIDAQTGKVGINKTMPQYDLDVNGTLNATVLRGDGSEITGIPIVPNVWSSTTNWQQNVTGTNYYPNGTTQTSTFYTNLTPSKSGYIRVSYYPSKIQFLQDVGVASFTFSVSAAGTVFESTYNLTNVKTGYVSHGPYVVLVPTSESSTISMRMKWSIDQLSVGGAIFNYSENTLSGKLFAEYVTPTYGSVF